MGASIRKVILHVTTKGNPSRLAEFLNKREMKEVESVLIESSQ